MTRTDFLAECPRAAEAALDSKLFNDFALRVGPSGPTFWGDMVEFRLQRPGFTANYGWVLENPAVRVLSITAFRAEICWVIENLKDWNKTEQKALVKLFERIRKGV